MSRHAIHLRLVISLPVAVCSLLAVATAALAEAPPGDDKSLKTRALEMGAKLLQGNAPPARMDIYLVGFHPMKDHPDQQMEAHHYCQQVNQDFAQCVLFDGNGSDAKLTGIEYIISEKLFDSLPEDERDYWHPHNGEILSGQLVAPGIPGPAEHALMKDKMNSYGKTWHVWHTGAMGEPGAALPLGPPMLAWSFNRDGEAKPGLVERRDEQVGIDTAEKRRERTDLQSLAKPQAGVDALRSAFPDATPIPGVVDRNTAAAAPAAGSR
ncbi:MAG TPA: OBAP family protein [Burkholderiaceae bacterium]|nr:OBAP family protein [Burkholderiaceae bacterium]